MLDAANVKARRTACSLNKGALTLDGWGPHEEAD